MLTSDKVSFSSKIVLHMLLNNEVKAFFNNPYQGKVESIYLESSIKNRTRFANALANFTIVLLAPSSKETSLDLRTMNIEDRVLGLSTGFL